MADKKPRYFTKLATTDPERLSDISTRGGRSSVARHGNDTAAARARAGTLAKRIAIADPSGDLPPAELAPRLDFMLRAHMAKMTAGRVVSAARRREAKAHAHDLCGSRSDWTAAEMAAHDWQGCPTAAAVHTALAAYATQKAGQGA
jgi:hypothetical protein